MGHPKIGNKIEDTLAQCETPRQKAEAFYQPSFGKYPREKGRFAQRLASCLDSDEVSFTVPAYIREAINHATGLEGK